MLFNSFVFLYFVLATFSLYYLPVLRKHQVALLVLASLLFYSWNNPALLALLIASIACNVYLSHKLAHAAETHLSKILAGGLAFNLGLIVFFKYAGLVVQTAGLQHTLLGRHLRDIPLPIGISFYTFEAISLLVDVTRARAARAETFVAPKPLTHTIHTSLFVSFFPHLISGPILKAHDFYPQISEKRFSDIDWWYATRLLILGFFLKCVIADNLKDITSEMIYPKFLIYHSLTLVSLVIGYAMQIFADFAGYSLIAIGLGALFGYRLPVNFNFPYIADSLSDFWRRWHISLSSWLKEYLYFPLGGNRHGAFRAYINLFVVMFLGGLWHGAAWSFAVWGMYHGLGLALERYCKDRFPNATARIPRGIKIGAVFSFVTLGWLLFKYDDFHLVPMYLNAIAQNARMDMGGQRILIVSVGLLSFPVIVYHALHLFERMKPRHPALELFVYGAMLASCIVSPGLSGEFIYFQF